MLTISTEHFSSHSKNKLLAELFNFDQLITKVLKSK